MKVDIWNKKTNTYIKYADVTFIANDTLITNKKGNLKEAFAIESKTQGKKYYDKEYFTLDFIHE